LQLRLPRKALGRTWADENRGSQCCPRVSLLAVRARFTAGSENRISGHGFSMRGFE